MRRAGIVGIVTGLWLVAGAGPAAAHAIGGGLDLPLPLSTFVAGVGLALALAFSGLAVVWPAPRWQSVSAGRALGAWGRWMVVALMVVGLVGFALVITAGLLGEDRRTNAAPTLVWVYFWLVVPVLGVLVGDLWRHLNPWRTLAGDRQRPAYPPASAEGVYPAALAFVVFAWLALVPTYSREPGVVALAAILYTVYLGAAVYVSDRERAFGSFEAFTPYNYLVGAIAPVELDAAGTWRWHGWLRRLPTVPVRRGLALFVTAVIGAIAYDGVSGSEWWDDLWGTTRFEEWFGTAALLATIAVAWALFQAATWAAARIGGTRPAAEVAGSFAHVLVPVGLAYALTHYFTAIVFEGQVLLSVASDPLGLGSDYFGTARREVELWIGPTAVWWVQLTVIVAGHVAAAVLAHDRALALFPKDRAVRSQYPLLALLVVLAGAGLVLLSVA